MQTLKKHLIHTLNKNKISNITSVYIGGGTPNTIKASLYKPLFELLAPLIKDEFRDNVCIEANPKRLNKNWLKDMYALGVRRLSLGVQSFDTNKLKLLGRNHTKDDIEQFVNEAKTQGFNNISIDLIYDTKLDTKKFLQNEVRHISQLDIEHISAYSLMLKEHTAFVGKQYIKKNSHLNAKFLFELLLNKGFWQYEISSFARDKKHRSYHNLGYWRGCDFLAIGAGAIEQINKRRNHYYNDVKEYIKNYTTPMSIEVLEHDTIALERLFLGLRSIVGVCLDGLSKEQLKKIEFLCDENKGYVSDDRFFCNDYLLADEIALYLV